MNSADFFDDNFCDRLLGGRENRTSSRMPRGVDLMARHSGPAVSQVAWLALSLLGLGLTLVASVRAIDRTELTYSGLWGRTSVTAAASSVLTERRQRGVLTCPVHGTGDVTVHGTGDVGEAGFGSKNTANSGRLKRCRLAPGEVACLVSEDFLGAGHLFRVEARGCSSGESGGTERGTSGAEDGVFLSGSAGLGAGGAGAGIVTGAESASAGRVELPSRRLFQLPRMSFERPATVLAECELVGSVGGLGIYCEGSVRLSAEQLRGRLGAFAVSGLLEGVERVLGSVLDVDGSGGLTVVVGELDPAGESGEFPFWGCVREADFLGGESGLAGDILYLDSGVSEISELEWRSLLVHELAHAACFSRLLERRVAGLSELSVPRWFHEGLAHLVEHELAGECGLARRRLESCWGDPGLAPVVVNLQQMTWGASRRGSRASAYRFLRAGIGGDVLRAGRLAGELRESACFEDLLNCVLGGAAEVVLRRWAAGEVRAMLATSPQVIPQLSAGCVTERRVLGTAFVVWRAGSEGLDVTVAAGDDSDWTLTVIRP